MDSRDLQGTARHVQQNQPYRVLVKVGLVAYGVVHLVTFGWPSGSRWRGGGEATTPGRCANRPRPRSAWC